MPLVRVEVRNEYALGAPELYREANNEDPKELLEGLSVSGLVGILRQLGDLAEFAAEVFHGLQEEVMGASSRSHKLMVRVRRMETALSSLEKALLAQRSHLHFAYTAGSNWHPRIRCEQNHFLYNDVPQFIADLYEDSRVPPSLHLLDRFDPGGPGSCLRRYSDPTFCKKASMASGEATAEKTSKSKKGRKVKKRSWTRSREVSLDASFSYNSGRTQFIQMNVDGHSSSSRTASTCDATQRSDLAIRTTSDLRNRSGYVEGDLHPVNSVQPEEQESRESISSLVKRRESAFLDYNFLEEKITDAYDDIDIYPSQEETGCSSYSVTWDEKNGTPEPKTQDSDNEGMKQGNNNRHLESFSPDLDLHILSHNAIGFDIVDKMDIMPRDQVVPAPESGDTHLDDIECEADHFMDALNTIKSECETDTDCNKKQAVQLEDKGGDEGVSEAIRHDLERESPSSTSSNVLANNSLISGNCGNNLISLSPKSFHATISNVDEFNSVFIVDKDLQSSERAKDSLTRGSPQSVDSHENDNNVESVSCAITSYFRDGRPGMPITDDTWTGLESQKHVPETTNATSVTFWTNGGLLGLQPSKPPDFSILNALSDKDAKQAVQTENFRHIEEDDQESGTSFRKTLWKIPPADLDIKLGTLGDSRDRNHNSNITKSSVISSPMFELSNKLHSTGSNKKLVPCNDHNPYINQKNLPTFPVRNKNPTGTESPIMLSPSSSPPLAHMKISFQPIDGFKTSKLKLKFPDGNNSNSKNGSDIFPSFHLVPEEPITRHNNGWDSDADTFYRSSPSLSDDDSHSNHSESNSEQWESSESTTNKDCGLYDALRKISLTESPSTVPENGYFDIQRSGTVNGSFRKESRDDIRLEGFVERSVVPTPAPPPLLPVEWQKWEASPKDSFYEFGLTLSVSMISQPKPGALNEDQMDTQKVKSGLRKPNGQLETKQGKSIDENDFLHQIRTKSFNLRPTVTTKPTIPSGGSANDVQVSAIQEKANAIRQAVGSDGEDDGNWSEA